MSLRIGIYDFFAYTIPGFVHFILFAYLANLFNIVDKIDIYKISIAHLIIVSGFAFVLGLVFDPLSDKLWFSLFKTKHSKEKAIQEMTRRYPEFNLNIKPDDWILFLDYIKNRNLDLGFEFDNINAQSKMMRNISFGLLLFGLSFIVNLILDFKVILIFSPIICFLFSIVLILKAKKFYDWYYCFIFEAIISEQIQLDKYISYSKTN